MGFLKDLFTWLSGGEFVAGTQRLSAEDLRVGFRCRQEPGLRRSALVAPFLGRVLAFAIVSRLGLGLISAQSQALEFDRTYAQLTRLLQIRVQEGRVDYAGLKATPKELDSYLDSVARVARAQFRLWSEADQIAFLCNAYNTYTLKLIRDHYPVKSIKDIGTLLRGPWDQPVVKLFGDTQSLNQLEHKMLRKDYDEPRIHFALVCAAKGCPPLRSEAYVGGKLEVQLADQGRRFMASRDRNRVEVSKRVVVLSPIFKWYAEDFEKRGGSVLGFVKPFWPLDIGSKVEPGFEVEYSDYDWSLNDGRSGG